MINEFLHWWGEQLADCLPARWRAGAASQAVLLDWRNDRSVSVSTRRGGTAEVRDSVAITPEAGPALRAAIARCGARQTGGGWTLVLRLPGRMLLERDVTLPIAAARAPDRVIGYEMDRLTPFRAEDVFWSCRPAGRDAARGQAAFRLALIPKASVRPLLDALGQLGVSPAALEAPREGGDACLIGLQADKPGRARRERRVTLALAALCLCLALAAAASPFVRQAMNEAELDARITALRPRVTEVEALRRRVQAEAASGDAVGQEYAALGDPLAALAALTALLPDDTFLQEFSLAQRKLGLRGHSASASRLIAALAADASIRNPAFAAPVVRTESGQRDVFSIRAEWAAGQ